MVTASRTPSPRRTALWLLRRSFWRVHQMARARFAEWRAEDDEVLRAEVAALMQRVGRRCVAADRDFWPSLLNERLGLRAHSAAAVAPAGRDGTAAAELPAPGGAPDREVSSAASVWRLVGLAMEGEEGAAQDPEREAADVAPGRRQQQQQSAEHLQQALSGEAAPAPAPGLLSRTLAGLQAHAQAAAALLFQAPAAVDCVTLADVARHLGSDRVVQYAGLLGTWLLAWADGVRESGRARLPWPQLAVGRRSALRLRLDWRGVTRPPRPQQLSLELVFGELS